MSDTGATDHLTNELDKLHMKEQYHGSDNVHTANGAGMRITHIGQSFISTPSHPLHLKDVLHVPSVTRNLLSVKKFTRDNNVFFEFHPWYFCVKDRDTREVLLRGDGRGSLYNLALSSAQAKQVFSSTKVSRERWHSRLGHPAIQIVQHVLHRHELPSESVNKVVICDACQQGKSHQLPFSLSTHVTTSPLEIIHSDVWVLPKLLLVDINTMSVLLMLIVVLHGFIFLNISLKCSKFSFSFNNMLNVS
jgi:histone deacetylase 1/2